MGERWVRMGLLAGTLGACGVENPYKDGIPEPADAGPPGPTGTAPDAPSSLVATAGDGTMRLAWQTVAGTHAYRVRWSLASGITRGNSAAMPAPGTPFVHSGLAPGVTYYYAVSALGSAGAESAVSNEVSAPTTGGSGLAAPGGV